MISKCPCLLLLPAVLQTLENIQSLNTFSCIGRLNLNEICRVCVCVGGRSLGQQ